MKKLLISFFLLGSLLASAQSPTFTRVLNGDSIDNSHSMFQSSNGDYYILSSTNSYGAGGMDIQVTKTDGLGDVDWSYTYGTGGTDIGYKIKPTSDGGAIIAGYSDGFSSYGEDGIILKINSSGTTQWVRAIRTDSNERCLDVIQARNGIIYATGYVEIDSLEKNILVTRMSASGSVSWVKTYGGIGDDIGNALVEDNFQRIIIAGSTTNDSVTVGGNGDKDIQLLALNAGGTILQSKNYGTASDDEATSIISTNANKFLVGGNTSGGSGSGQDVFICEFDTNYSVVNSNWFGTLSGDVAHSINYKQTGEITVTMSSEGGLSSRDIVLFQTTNIGGLANQNFIGGVDADANSFIDITRSDAFGYSILASGVSFGGTNSEDLYLMNISKDLTTNCNDNVGMLIEGSYTLTSNGYSSNYNTGQAFTVSLTRNSVTNSDSTMCCNLVAQTAGDSFTICTNDQLRIGKTSNSGYTYSWTAAGSSWTSSGANPTVSPSSNTLYKLVVSSSDEACASDSALVYVTVNSRQSIPSLSDTFLCVDDSVTLTAASNMINYSWITKNSIFNTQEIELKDSDTAYLSMIDANSCVYRDTVEVDLKPLPIFNLGSDTTICENLAITLTGPSGMSNYKWNGTNSSSNTYTTSVSQIHTLEVTSNFGCVASDEIQILTNPSSTFTLGPDTSVCEGEAFSIIGPTVLSGYIWNDTASSNYTIDVTSGGTYWLEAYNSFGCPSYDTIQLTMLAAPIFDLGIDTGFCDGGNLVLQGPTGLEYLWFNGSDQQFFTATGTGKYYLTVTNASECSYTDTINVEEYALPTIFLGNDTTIAVGNSLLLSPGSGYSNYNWSTSETSESISVDASGTYFVEVTDNNGCKGSDTIVVTVSASVHYLQGSKIEMYPNPANAALNLVTDGNIIGARIEIVDVQGKMVHSEIAASNSLRLSVGDYESGLYHVILHKDNITLTFKVMIDHQ